MQSTLNSWVNPFLPSDGEICHLASGVTAPEKVEKDLLQAYEKGRDAMSTSITKRLISR